MDLETEERRGERLKMVLWATPDVVIVLVGEAGNGNADWDLGQ